MWTELWWAGLFLMHFMKFQPCLKALKCSQLPSASWGWEGGQHLAGRTAPCREDREQTGGSFSFIPDGMLVTCLAMQKAMQKAHEVLGHLPCSWKSPAVKAVRWCSHGAAKLGLQGFLLNHIIYSITCRRQLFVSQITKISHILL